MSISRAAWAALLDWVPPPVQLSIALVLVLIILTKLVPFLLRLAGKGLRLGWSPMLGLLTYPEYLATSMCRRAGQPLLPGTYTYGRVLNALASAGTGLGRWLQERFTKMLRYPWKTTIFVIALVVGCWYAAPKIPPGEPKTLVGHINTDDVRINSWLATGQWVPSARTTPACAATTPAKHARHKQTTRRKRK